jgi:hypothetical protein
MPSTRGPTVMQSHAFLRRTRLPEDALGITTLTLLNVVPGSRYRVERVGDGSLATPNSQATGIVAGGGSAEEIPDPNERVDITLTLDYFAPGNANNQLRIKVRQGTDAPFYLPFETRVTLSQAPSVSFVSQIPDE